MPDSIEDLPQLYREGIRLFNAEQFFECHEAWEELWAESTGEEKKFLQGMIQAAVALFHFGNENFGGAKKLYLSAMKLLEPCGDPFYGLELQRFREDFTICFADLLESPDAWPTGLELRDDLVPKLYLVGQE